MKWGNTSSNCRCCLGIKVFDESETDYPSLVLSYKIKKMENIYLVWCMCLKKVLKWKLVLWINKKEAI